jgi:hypothetical protein
MSDSKKSKICKFFLKGECHHGTDCKFEHNKDICKNYFFEGKCKRGDKCKFKHTQTIMNKRPKNTENFNPSHKEADLNILVGKPNDKVFYLDKYTENDIIIIPNFIEELSNNETYDKLLKEIRGSGVNESELWKLWHGDNHLIADDKLPWKDNCPVFNGIIKKIEEYFRMDIKSTRFNWYKDSTDWKPFHHDAAAVKEHIAKVQNFTVGISLGATRSIAFEKADNSKIVLSIPLPSGTVYAFSKNVNINWKHGVPQVNPLKSFSDGRISIIAWGAVDMD